ncbi:MAG TPA: DNA translocase FtsK [Candidatus Dormibacteraeota bacterium]|nr:DNA translocase FtsK [Candidatus Dormibacteraeota bacterium]
MVKTKRRRAPKPRATRPRRRPSTARTGRPASPGLRLKSSQQRELAGISAIAFGLVWMILLAFPQAKLAFDFGHVIGAGVGVGGWIIGVSLVAAGLGMLASRTSERSGGQVLLALVVSAIAAISMAATVHAGSGGALGAAIGPRMSSLIGAPATLVALAGLALAGLIIGLEIYPSRVSALALNRMGDAASKAFTGTPTLGSSGRAGLAPAARAQLGGAAPLPGDHSDPGAAEEELAPEAFQRIFEGLDEVEVDPIAEAAAAEAVEVEGTPVVAVAPLPIATEMQELDDEPEPVWALPSVDLLDSASGKRERLRDEIRSRIRTIETTLGNFGVQCKVMGVNAGPTVTQYELQPAPGVAVRKVLAYQPDLSMALAAPIRIQAPIPGKSAIGIEVPNKAAQLVTLKEVVQAPTFNAVKSKLAVALGADVSGHPVLGDLAGMPHLLIAGTTGSGKSVCINAVLAGLLLQSTPRDLRLILVDPKRVELSNFSGLPHLLVPVVVDADPAVAALRWAVMEMEQRYKLFAGHGARNITNFNERAPQLGLHPLPKIVIVIDELADLMMVAANEIEDLICRIAQLARAVGIHLIVATQRPSADIITGLIKANIPSRIAFAVSSGVDSRVILDEMGAEKLLGRGDMLYLPIDAGKAVRLQGAYVSDRELDQLIGWWKAQGRPRYQEEILQAAALAPTQGDPALRRDPLFERAGRIVIGEQRGAASLLQRKLNVGYTRAARLIDQLSDARVVGPYEGSKSREVLMNLAELEQMLDASEDAE